MIKSNISSSTSLVLVLIAASSLLSMIGLIQIDAIVHRDLYKYGLRFSYEWAMPYWTMTAIVFGMGWFNIIAAITFQLYILLLRKREAEVLTVKEEALELETPTVPQPAEVKREEMEKVEETEKPKETPTPVVEIEQKPGEGKEETIKTAEETSQAKPTEEEQGAKPKEGTESKPEETPTPNVETQSETQKESEESPILIGVTEGEI